MPRREDRHQRQKRNDGKVLKEKDRECFLAVRGLHVAALFEQLHDERGRRQREPHPGDEGGLPRAADDEQWIEHHQRAGDEQLRGAEPEDVPAHGPQSRKLELEPDDEEEEDDPQLRDVHDRLRVAEKTEPARADDDPRREVTEDRTETQLAEERHREHGGGQKDRRLRKHRRSL